MTSFCFPYNGVIKTLIEAFVPVSLCSVYLPVYMPFRGVDCHLELKDWPILLTLAMVKGYCDCGWWCFIVVAEGVCWTSSVNGLYSFLLIYVNWVVPSFSIMLVMMSAFCSCEFSWEAWQVWPANLAWTMWWLLMVFGFAEFMPFSRNLIKGKHESLESV